MATLLDDLSMVVFDGTSKRLRPDIIRLKLKEKLQLYALDFIYNSRKYNQFTFYGGTCLRKCFGTSRMSEDINFETLETFDKHLFAEDIIRHFKETVLYDKVTATSPGKSINRVVLKFPVLNELGLTPHIDEKLNVKIEVDDTSHVYPAEFKTLSEDKFSFVIKHYDLPTLMAGKIAACLERIYKKGNTGVNVKGRDFFDLLWFMQGGVMPNPERLVNTKGAYTIRSAFENLAAKISNLPLRALSIDLEPLFEDGQFVKIWVENFKNEFSKLYDNYMRRL